MTSGSGTTTVTEASSHRPATASAELVLAWVFPRPGEAPTRLAPPTGQGHAEVAIGHDAAEVVIGRDAACAVRLEGSDVSRRHAALSWNAAGVVTIRDLGSRNGVRVNGRAVPESPLGLGDVVRLGGWIGVVTTTPGPLEEIAAGFYGGAALQAAVAPLARAARSDLPIILEGETGTGKELAARALHDWSGRSGPLVAVNCAALPEGLAEGELFGYRRGAFTGADRPSPGFFRSAEGGTLFLDEVADLPTALQAKLLRALEQREVQPLGETRPVAVDVRVVVASQQSLGDVAREGRFRPDLLARLDGLTVRLPPLRRRREDVPPLFSRLLTAFGQGRVPAVDSDVIERLCLHDWPFNVRELVLLVRRLLTLHGDEPSLAAHHLPDRIGAAAAAPPTGAVQVPAAPSEPLELPALVVALRAAGGNVARAAAMLGITRQRAYRLMEGQAVDLEAMRKAEEPRR